MTSLEMITAFIFNILSITLWGWVFIAYMEPVICKDATDRHKFMTRPLSVRLRIFKRSLHNRRYVSDLIKFTMSFAIIIIKVGDTYAGVLPIFGWLRIVASILVPIALIIDTVIRGLRPKLYTAFKDFWQGTD